MSKTASKPCRHHWLIEPVSGPESKAVCRICKAQSTFRNYAMLDVQQTNQVTWLALRGNHKAIPYKHQRPTAAYYEAI